MFRGLLIYNSIDAKRNEWFISQLIKRAAEYDISLSLFTGAADSGLSSLLSGTDIVLNRCRDVMVNLLCREQGVICVNNELTVRLGNNKWENHLFCIENNIPALDTVLIEEGTPLLPFPFVMKEIAGHGGHEVYWVESPKKYESLIRKPGKSYIAQRAVSERTSDLRLYMMGDKIMASIMRSSTEDFRSNFSRGGRIRLFEPDDEVRKTALKVQRLLDSDFIGIDFIPDRGRWYLNEIEDMVGSRMVYQLTDTDVAGLYLARARKRIDDFSYDK